MSWQLDYLSEYCAYGPKPYGGLNLLHLDLTTRAGGLSDAWSVAWLLGSNQGGARVYIGCYLVGLLEFKTYLC